MPDYKRDDLKEIASGLDKLVLEAEMSDAIQPKIDMEEVKAFISQYSPDIGKLKMAIFKNKDFCEFVGIEVIDNSIESMLKVSEFIQKNHNTYSSSSLTP